MFDSVFLFFFQAEDGIRDGRVTGVQTCALPILLATTVIGLLGKYCQPIIDASFTAALEDSMAKIQEGETTRKIVLVKAVQHLRKVMLELIAHEEELGGQLGGVVSHQKLVDSSFKTPCPRCGAGLRIVRNRSTGK